MHFPASKVQTRCSLEGLLLPRFLIWLLMTLQMHRRRPILRTSLSLPTSFILIFLQTPYNYHRALVWTAIMTVLSHLDPVFSNVVSIEAVNEPMMNATFTPGYGTCEFLLVLVLL